MWFKKLLSGILLFRRSSKDFLRNAVVDNIYVKTQPTSEIRQGTQIPKTCTEANNANIDTAEERLGTDDLLLTISKSKMSSVFPKAVTATLERFKTNSKDVVYAVPFDEMPGPSSLRSIANVYRHIPVISTQLTTLFLSKAQQVGKLSPSTGINQEGSWIQSVMSSFRPYDLLFERYGPVLRLHGPFGGDIVMLSLPEHIETVYNVDSQYPVRALLDSMEVYRKSKVTPNMPSYEGDYELLREALKYSLDLKLVDFDSMLEQIADDLIHRISSNRNMQDEVSDNFHKELHKWGLECWSQLIFNNKVGFLQKNNLSDLSEAGRMLNSLIEASQALRNCESGLQFWRILPTYSWTKLTSAIDMLEGLLCRNLRLNYIKLSKMNRNAKDAQRLCLLDAMIIKEKLTSDEIITTVLDLLIIGVTSTLLVMANEVAYHKDENFECALRYEPERWMDEFSNPFDPLAAMPFCHGQTELIKQIAYRQLAILIAKLLRNFKFEYHYGRIHQDGKVLAIPKKPFRFRFVERAE
ncbi:probable cytochrome P450 301a1, mitochondrial isoform X3 [Rhodnius prolixus]|uniref:probable cytochrome P450 301a1, mitochondrial isoform X3 n=1 Tax=Rhodnius prolixus TaxID=13249 RepID=UPI003D18F6BF